MAILVTSDIHLTNKPLDEYRWGLFSWLRKMIKQHGAHALLLLGDLTDAKDRHEAALVNRLVDELDGIASMAGVWILKANHDYIDEDMPFFGFTRHIEGITYVSRPLIAEIDGMRVALLPNTRDHAAAWHGLDFSRCAYIFCHQTFDGAKAENGAALRGIHPSYFDSLPTLPMRCKVISGDIHVPQVVGKRIVYVGSPYRVHFGDAFLPRVLLIEDDRWIDLRFPCPSREVIDVTPSRKFVYGDFPKGTQVKVRVHLKRQEFGDKDAIREDIRKVMESRAWELCGLEWKLVQPRSVARDAEELATIQTPRDIVLAYASDKKLSKDSAQLGISFIEEASK